MISVPCTPKIVPRLRLRLKWSIGFTLLLIVGLYFNSTFRLPFPNDNDNTAIRETERIFQQQQQQIPRCSINLYGLPRAFKSLVLPSIIKNIILPNAAYGCDYYVHYYEQTEEPGGRAGEGGVINPEEILFLREHVELVAKERNLNRIPTVMFCKDREEDFWEQYDTLLQKIRTTKDSKGRYLYFPWKESSYQYPTTTDNIVKMWHSIQASWQLMEDTAKQNGIEYSRVAMLRSDVVFMTPLDIFEKGNGQKDTDNKYAVVPAFGKYPVNDRLIYGPAIAVQVWAAQRFERMDNHVQWVLRNMPGYGLQSERFVKHALFPGIEEQGVEIVEHERLCFFRARSDESVWISDCARYAEPRVMEFLGNDKKGAVEKVLGRKCGATTVFHKPFRVSLDCFK